MPFGLRKATTTFQRLNTVLCGVWWPPVALVCECCRLPSWSYNYCTGQFPTWLLVPSPPAFFVLMLWNHAHLHPALCCFFWLASVWVIVLVCTLQHTHPPTDSLIVTLTIPSLWFVLFYPFLNKYVFLVFKPYSPRFCCVQSLLADLWQVRCCIFRRYSGLLIHLVWSY